MQHTLEKREPYTHHSWEIERKRPLEELGIHRRIILKLVLKE